MTVIVLGKHGVFKKRVSREPAPAFRYWIAIWHIGLAKHYLADTYQLSVSFVLPSQVITSLKNPNRHGEVPVPRFQGGELRYTSALSDCSQIELGFILICLLAAS